VTETKEKNEDEIVYEKKWYIIHTYSGYEKKVATDLEKRIESLDLTDRVFRILVPEEEVLEEKRGKQVKVSRKLFPSKIEVILEEREPYAYVKKGDKTLLADKDLNIYGDILEDPSKNIPVIEYTSDESLAQIKTILSKIKNKDFYAMISEIRQSEKNYEIVLINNVKIITDTLVTEKKYNDAYKLYERIKKEKPVTSMDLRFIDIVVKS